MVTLLVKVGILPNVADNGVTEELTVKLNVLLLVPEALSVTVIVIENTPDTFGVPDTTPVPLTILRPEGNPVAPYEYGVVPPLAVTGVNAVAAVPCVNVGREPDTVVLNATAAAATVSVNVLLLVCGVGLPLSVTVTVTEKLPDTFGVPDTTPVPLAIVTPAGNPVAAYE